MSLNACLEIALLITLRRIRRRNDKLTNPLHLFLPLLNHGFDLQLQLGDVELQLSALLMELIQFSLHLNQEQPLIRLNTLSRNFIYSYTKFKERYTPTNAKDLHLIEICSFSRRVQDTVGILEDYMVRNVQGVNLHSSPHGPAPSSPSLHSHEVRFASLAH